MKSILDLALLIQEKVFLQERLKVLDKEIEQMSVKAYLELGEKHDHR